MGLHALSVGEDEHHGAGIALAEQFVGEPLVVDQAEVRLGQQRRPRGTAQAVEPPGTGPVLGVHPFVMP